MAQILLKLCVLILAFVLFVALAALGCLIVIYVEALAGVQHWMIQEEP
jgi:hypothetical protein